MKHLFFGIFFIGLMIYVFSISGFSILYVLDIPSIVFVVVFSFIVLLTTYSLRDISANIINGFTKCIDNEKNRYTLIFLEFLEKTLFFVGITGFLTGIISALATIADFEKIGPALAVALITPLYATLINLIIVRPLITGKKESFKLSFYFLKFSKNFSGNIMFVTFHENPYLFITTSIFLSESFVFRVSTNSLEPIPLIL